jgi:hypothetical protein
MRRNPSFAAVSNKINSIRRTPDLDSGNTFSLGGRSMSANSANAAGDSRAVCARLVLC